MNDLIILGAGGSAFDIASIVTQINKVQPTWNILGFLDDNPELIGPRFMHYKVLGKIETCDQYKDVYFVSSIAHSNKRNIRKEIYDKVSRTGGKFATIIHPSSVIYEEASVGEGCIINANCVIGSRVKIGKDVHIAYGCNLGHEVEIGDHCAFGCGVNLSSGVVVGEGCYIGCGVSSTYDVCIEPDSLVTVGSAIVRTLINKNKEIENTWIGNPAEISYEYMKKYHRLGKLTFE